MKRLLKRLLFRPPVAHLHRIFCRRGAAILRYHSVLENPGLHQNSIGLGIIHPASVFEKQMRILKREYIPVTVNDVIAFVRGDMELPKRAVAVTFDDGYADNFQIAAPIMDNYGITGAFYLTTDPIMGLGAPWFVRLRYAIMTSKCESWRLPFRSGIVSFSTENSRCQAFVLASRFCATLHGEKQRDWIAEVESTLGILPPQFMDSLMMTWSQASELAARGHLIGSHSCSHPNIARIDQAGAVCEIRDSKLFIEERLNISVEHFSYPGPALRPHWNDCTQTISAIAGYCSAVTSEYGLVRHLDDPLCLKRVAAPQNCDDFRYRLDRLFLCP